MGMRRWRHYETAAGRRPVKELLNRLSDEDVAAVTVAMDEVRGKGLRSARHLQEGIYEVRAEGMGVTYRVLFAPQEVLLTLTAYTKKTQKTPSQVIRLARRRLQDWERRGAKQKKLLRRL